MTVLDCESLDSALDCVATLLGRRRSDLVATMEELPIDTFDDMVSESWSTPFDVLWKHLMDEAVPPTPAEIRWFHATRVEPTANFSEGIQTLGERLPNIRDFLQELMSRNGISHAGNRDGGGHAGHLFSSKSERVGAWGPFAFLVRDAILRHSPINHDYLRVPEIVEDCAAVLAGTNDQLLLTAFREATKPCIVKFRSREARPDAVPIAAVYCYLALHGEDPGIDGNTCFDGEGVAVPAADVIAVEFLDSTR